MKNQAKKKKVLPEQEATQPIIAEGAKEPGLC